MRLDDVRSRFAPGQQPDPAPTDPPPYRPVAPFIEPLIIAVEAIRDYVRFTSPESPTRAKGARPPTIDSILQIVLATRARIAASQAPGLSPVASLVDHAIDHIQFADNQRSRSAVHTALENARDRLNHAIHILTPYPPARWFPDTQPSLHVAANARIDWPIDPSFGSALGELPPKHPRCR